MTMKTHFLALCGAALILTILPVRAQTVSPIETVSPVVGGLQMTAQLSKARFAVGEPLRLVVTLQNVGKSPVMVREAADFSGFGFAVRDRNGQVVPKTRQGTLFGQPNLFRSVPPRVTTLRPSEIKRTTFLLGALFDFSLSGSYSLKLLRATDKLDAARQRTARLWLECGPLKFELSEPDAAQPNDGSRWTPAPLGVRAPQEIAYTLHDGPIRAFQRGTDGQAWPLQGFHPISFPFGKLSTAHGEPALNVPTVSELRTGPDGRGIYAFSGPHAFFETRKQQRLLWQFERTSSGALMPLSPPRLALDFQLLDLRFDPTGRFAFAYGQKILSSKVIPSPRKGEEPTVLEPKSTLLQAMRVAPNGALTPLRATIIGTDLPSNGQMSLAFHPRKPLLYLLHDIEPRIYRFRIGNDGTLLALAPIALKTGSSLRALAFSGDGRFAYGLVNPYKKEGIESFRVGEDGELTPLGPKIPLGAQGVSMVAHPDGSVYVLTWRDNGGPLIGSVKAFHIGAEGQLSPLAARALASGEQGFGSNLLLSPSGRFLYLMGRRTSVFKIATNGNLSPPEPLSDAEDVSHSNAGSEVNLAVVSAAPKPETNSLQLDLEAHTSGPNVSLTATLRNPTSLTFSLPSLVFPRDFGIEVRHFWTRDAPQSSGETVTLTRYGQKLAQEKATSIPLELGSQKQLSTQLVLSRIFDLSRPGIYRVEVMAVPSMAQGFSGSTVQSEALQIEVRPQPETIETSPQAGSSRAKPTRRF